MWPLGQPPRIYAGRAAGRSRRVESCCFKSAWLSARPSRAAPALRWRGSKAARGGSAPRAGRQVSRCCSLDEAGHALDPEPLRDGSCGMCCGRVAPSASTDGFGLGPGLTLPGSCTHKHALAARIGRRILLWTPANSSKYAPGNPISRGPNDCYHRRSSSSPKACVSLSTRPRCFACRVPWPSDANQREAVSVQRWEGQHIWKHTPTERPERRPRARTLPCCARRPFGGPSLFTISTGCP